ncbi:MAG: SDR family oxidoreductase [Pseudomonadota bacterium]
MAKRNFKDKTVVITGGASGIGLATAQRFARAGARLALIDADGDGLARCAEDFRRQGVPVEAITTDVTSQPDCAAAMDRIIARFGGIDVLFNNAGITQRGAFRDTDVSVYQRVMAVNFFGALYCTKAAIDSLIARCGVIISNESIAGVAPVLGRTGYCASKHAMHGLFTSLRAEVRHLGVHVMIVCPGFIKTNLQTRALGCDGTVTRHPQSHVGRHDTAENAADAIFRGAERERPMIVLTPVGKLGVLLSRFVPAFYERQMTRRLKSELDY